MVFVPVISAIDSKTSFLSDSVLFLLYSKVDLFVEVVKHYSGDRISKRKADRKAKDDRLKQQVADTQKLKPKPMSTEAKSIMDDVPVFGKTPASNKKK